MIKRALLLFLVLTFLLSAQILVAQEDGVVYAALGADFDQLDPHLTNNSLGYQMAITFYDRLVALDPDGNVVPALATRWEGSGADQLTMWLHPDATCADGTALNAEAVANSLLRMGANATGSPYMYRTLGGVAGATEERYSVEFDNDEGSVTMVMNEPFSGLLIGLSMPWASVICPAGLANPDALVSEPQGSGPFVLSESLRGDRYVVDARPDYTWGPEGITSADPGFPKQIVFQVVSNESTAVNLFFNGDLNIIGVTGPDLDRVEAGGFFQTVGTNFGARWVQMNQDPGLIGTNPAVRQAVYKAISAQEWLDVGYSGRGQLSNSWISPEVVCYDPGLDPLFEETVGYDPDAAKQILLDAGYTEGSDGKLVDADGNPLVIRYAEASEGTGADVAELVILSLEDIGITVEANVTDFGGLIEMLFTTGEWDVAILPYGPPVPLPSAVQAFLSGDTATNTASMSNQTFLDELNAANASSLEDSCAHWSLAMASLLENFDYKPLGADNANWFGNGVEFTLYNGYIGTFDPVRTRIVE